MAGSLLVLPRQSPLTLGVVAAGSKLTFSRTGTSTAQNTYSDSALTTPNANPVVADSGGTFGKIYLDPSTGFDYRVKWTTSADVLIWQEDDIKAGSTASASYRLTDAAPTLYLVETDAAANNGHWRITVNGEQLSIDVGNDAESSWVQALTVDRTLNVVDSINLKATALQFNGTALTSSSSFSLGFTGFSANPSANSAQYAITGNLVALQLSFVTGTSNATTFTITGLPAAIRPLRKQVLRFPGLVDNGATLSTGQAVINTDGTITLYPSDSSTAWTNVGNKGGTGAGPAYTTLVYPIV